MTQRAAPDTIDDQPLDPAAERVRAKLMRFMVINLAILFLAVMAVVGALVYRSLSGGEEVAAPAPSELPTPPEGTVITGRIVLPEGATILSQSLSAGRLTTLVEAGGAREILIHDIAAARLVARFSVETE